MKIQFKNDFVVSRGNCAEVRKIRKLKNMAEIQKLYFDPMLTELEPDARVALISEKVNLAERTVKRYLLDMGFRRIVQHDFKQDEFLEIWERYGSRVDLVASSLQMSKRAVDAWARRFGLIGKKKYNMTARAAESNLTPCMQKIEKCSMHRCYNAGDCPAFRAWAGENVHKYVTEIYARYNYQERN